MRILLSVLLLKDSLEICAGRVFDLYLMIGETHKYDGFSCKCFGAQVEQTCYSVDLLSALQNNKY